MAHKMNSFLLAVALSLWYHSGWVVIADSPLLFPLLKQEFDSYWNEYKGKHERLYTSTQLEMVRRSIWETNLQTIQKHNIEFDLDKQSYTMGINKYCDMAPEEFKKINGLKLDNKLMRGPSPKFLRPANVKLPDSVDWREKGYTTPVEDQGSCGSCYAFSATGALEGQYFRKTGKLVSLSKQNLIDCSKSYGNKGCDGGLMDHSFSYVRDNGIDSEDKYPYEAVSNVCRFKNETIVTKGFGFVDIESGSEKDLQIAVATIGPISAGIDAIRPGFQFYRSGIYYDPECSSEFLNHGILVAGYGTENGQDYWLIKNSYGVSWGLKGYMKLARNRNNSCGIATSASYPLV